MGVTDIFGVQVDGDVINSRWVWSCGRNQGSAGESLLLAFQELLEEEVQD